MSQLACVLLAASFVLAVYATCLLWLERRLLCGPECPECVPEFAGVDTRTLPWRWKG